MKKKKFSVLAIGTSSMLVIFILLCLVTFAVLSLTSAKADARFSEKNTARLTAYYAASTRAEEKLAFADGLLRSAYQSCGGRKSAYEQAVREAFSAEAGYQLGSTAEGALTLSWQEEIQEGQQLSVILAVSFPTSPGDSFYRRQKWAVENTTDWAADNALPLVAFE